MRTPITAIRIVDLSKFMANPPRTEDEEVEVWFEEKKEGGDRELERLVCDRCSQTYTDEASIEGAKKQSEHWEEICKRDGVVPRGISPCPILFCPGELLLQQ